MKGLVYGVRMCAGGQNMLLARRGRMGYNKGEAPNNLQEAQACGTFLL